MDQMMGSVLNSCTCWRRWSCTCRRPRRPMWCLFRWKTKAEPHLVTYLLLSQTNALGTFRSITRFSPNSQNYFLYSKLISLEFLLIFFSEFLTRIELMKSFPCLNCGHSILFGTKCVAVFTSFHGWKALLKFGLVGFPFEIMCTPGHFGIEVAKWPND